MELLYIKRINFATIKLKKNYCRIVDKNIWQKKHNVINLNEEQNLDNIFNSDLDILKCNNQYEFTKLAPKYKNKKTKYFHSDEIDYIQFAPVSFKNNDIFFTNKDKHIKRHYNNPFASLVLDLFERKIYLKDDKLTVKLYHQQKTKNINCIYFAKITIITSITLNLKTGDITTVELTNRSGKPSTKRIRKNCFNVLLVLLTGKSLINLVGQYNEEYLHYISDFINDVEFFDTLKRAFGNDSINTNADFLQSLLKNSIKIKDYKLPNDFDWRMLLLFYPKSKLLKKNKNNLYNSILDLFKIKSKSTIKIVNQHPHMNVIKLAYICFMLGENYGKYVSQLSHDTLHNLSFDSKHCTEGISIYYKTGYFSTIARYNNICLSSRDKKHLIEFLNNTSSNFSFILSYTNFVFLMDHFDMLTKLRSYGINIHMEAKNDDELHSEHLMLSEKIQDARREYYLSRVFHNSTISDIETKMTVNHITIDEKTNERVIQCYEFEPVILKDEIEYKEEGKYMHHCVATYVDRVESIIISIRDTTSKHRVTCEFSTETGELTQARHFCNQIPPPQFQQAIERLSAKAIIHARKNKLKPIEIVAKKNENYISEASDYNDILELPFYG